MSTYEFPSGVYPASDEVTHGTAGVLFSARSGATQTATRSGSAWLYQVSFRNRNRRAYAKLTAAIARLNGRQHRIIAPIWSYPGPQGSASIGGGRVDGADQTGVILKTKGWSGRGAVLYAGDLIELQYAGRSSSNVDVEPRLHEVVVDAENAVQVDLEVWPPIVNAPDDNAVISIVHPRETWILVQDATFGRRADTSNEVQLTLASDLLVGT